VSSQAESETGPAEAYGLSWPGKAEALRSAEEPRTGRLVEMASESTGDPACGNLVIEGENLEVLKLLRREYAGRVKTIYIDPPYNTGNEFIYSDNYRGSRVEYARRNGARASAETDGRFHARWLSMIYPRLRIARDLLRDDGLLFVSIGEYELANLLLLLVELFGEENRLAVMTWRGMHTTRNSSKGFNRNTEYVVCFARSYAALVTGDPDTWLRTPRDKSGDYPYDDGDGRGAYKLDPLHARNYYRPFEHTFANGRIWSAPAGRYPAFSPENLRRMEAEGELDFRGREPRAKRYLARVREGVPPDTLLPSELVGFNKDGTADLERLFGTARVFDQPKPVRLIQHLLSIRRKVDRGSDEPEIVLDFFAGSGTTGEAVLRQNVVDGANRRFILVQAPEPTSNPDLPTISAITRERVRRALIEMAGDGEAPGGFRALQWVAESRPDRAHQKEDRRNGKE
jgi:adenine-specific DNA-methyltransferase